MPLPELNEVFRLDEDYDRDRASDGDSRYGAYLRQNRRLFADWDDADAVTTNPAQFTQAAWETATSPVMSPPFLDWTAERIQSVTCTTSEVDATLIARVHLAAPRPAQLQRFGRMADWERSTGWGGPAGYFTPYDDALTARPALLTTTVLLINVPDAQLHTPQTAPNTLSTFDAKTAVRLLAAVLEDHLMPILAALDDAPGRGR